MIDIGTGTGVLGITHKLERPQDSVTLTDISAEALAVAKENAQRLDAEVTLKFGSLFEPVSEERFDVILCNPPYISETEVDVMDQSVLEYEPKSALFAEDNGLAIYKELAASVKNHVKLGARIFLEIGYKQGEQVAEIFKKRLPDATVEIWKDFNGLDRVIAIHIL